MEPMIRSLEKRFLLFLFLPVTLLLLAMGFAGFVYARSTMLKQWEEAALLRLQRAAHVVDMRLARPRELIGLYLGSRPGPGDTLVRRAILDQLETTPGVIRIHHRGDLRRVSGKEAGPADRAGKGNTPVIVSPHPGDHGMQAHMGRRELTITAPRLDPDGSGESVSLIAELSSPEGSVVEELEVVMRFDFLIEDLPRTGWWQTRQYYLVDEFGSVLAGRSEGSTRRQLGDSGDPLEAEVLTALGSDLSGTRRGRGHPPDRIGGFYRLMEAPWTIVVFAPGDEILEPIIGFRNAYAATLAGFMLVILFLIRKNVRRVTRAVRQLSASADQISRGHFDEPLPVESRDDVGELVQSFNTMSRQLKERMQLKRSLDLAKEVQQNLIPAADPRIDGLDIAGASRYCDETGGDYFDYLKDCGTSGCRLRIIVGDVAGHGIASALLMSGVRASFRQRHGMGGSLEDVITDVNRQVALDVGDSGRFVTLFGLEIDAVNRRARWVRAGHEPGLLFRAEVQRFETLTGEGVSLGAVQQYPFKGYSVDGLSTGDMIILSTDGLWEARDAAGRMFGRERLKRLVQQRRRDDADTLLTAIFDAVDAHTGGSPPADDKTLIIIKVVPPPKNGL
jgi:sigma-B regulation protein RsbU (phosphoserine phosphatase)